MRLVSINYKRVPGEAEIKRVEARKSIEIKLNNLKVIKPVERQTFKKKKPLIKSLKNLDKRKREKENVLMGRCCDVTKYLLVAERFVLSRMVGKGSLRTRISDPNLES